MRLVRGLFSAILTTLGVLALVVWLVARFALSVVDDGSTLSGIASKALEQSEFRGVVVDQVNDRAIASLQAAGIDTAPYDAAIKGLITDTVETPEFQTAFLASLDAMRADLAADIRSTSPPVPVVFSMDVTPFVTTAVASVPGIAAFAESLQVEPFTKDVIGAKTVQNLRGPFGYADTARDWAGWLALALIGLGVLLSPKRLYVIPRIMLSLGIAALVAWLALRLVGDKLGEVGDKVGGGTAGEWVSNLLPTERVDQLTSFALRWGITLTVGAIILYIVFWIVRRTAKSAKKHRDEADETVAVGSRTKAQTRFDEVTDGPVDEHDHDHSDPNHRH